jgi:hypothetical protein
LSTWRNTIYFKLAVMDVGYFKVSLTQFGTALWWGVRVSVR